MKNWMLISLVAAGCLSAANLPLARRIGHYDPAKLTAVLGDRAHGGAPGGYRYMSLLPQAAMDRFQTFFTMFHRGQIPPKGGIGYHFSVDHEDGFIILDDDAGEFTVNGHTAALKGPVGVPVPMRAAHGYYNPTDQTKEWINIWVSATRASTITIDANNDLIGAPLEKKPAFFVTDFGRARLRPAPNYHGGTGTAQYFRAAPSEFFQTNWAYHDHLLLPSGATDGLHRHVGVEEIYYVMNGEGTAMVNDETGPIRKGDAVPVYLGEPHSFAPNAGSELEFIVFGIALEKGKLDTQIMR